MPKFNPYVHHRRSTRLKEYDYSQVGLYFITLCLQNKECLFGHIKCGSMVLNDAGENANACWFDIPNHFSNIRLHEHIIMPNHMHGIIEIVGSNDSSDPDQYSPNQQPTKHFSPTQFSPDPVGAKHLSPTVNCNQNGANDVNCDINCTQNGAKHINYDGNRANDVNCDDNGVENINCNNNGANDVNCDINCTQNRAKHINYDGNRAKDVSPLRSPSKTIGSVVRGYKTGVTKWFRTNMGDVFPIGRPVWQRNYWEHIIRDDKSHRIITEYIINNPVNWNKDSLR